MPHRTRLSSRVSTLFLCLAFVLPLTVSGASTSGPDPVFPPAAPESVGLSSAALERLAERIQRLVEDESIVGGEIHVVKDRRTVLHRAFGWADRNEARALAPDSIYCVRSMTKPVVGTAVQMLVDDGRLALDSPVHEILPSFGGSPADRITVGHLLNHTAGFPLSTIQRPLSEYTGLSEIAEEAAEAVGDREPGTRFRYSDASADVLGAIVAEITGTSIEEFLQERILDPLTMRDTLVRPDDPAALARIPTAYSGGTGAWSTYWEPTDPPIFPVFLPSQSLYSTTTDYARFLALWMDGGTASGRRLLSTAAVDRALAPASRIPGLPPSFGGLDAFYGQHWVVYSRTAGEGAGRPDLFGHDGSDGTHAWAWPDLDLMVLFFTHSRGTAAGAAVGRAVQTLLVDGGPPAPDRDEVAVQDVAGLYWDQTRPTAYYVVSPLGGDRLRVERPGLLSVVFESVGEPGRYSPEADPRAWIEFVRDESGAVTAMRHFFGGEIELDARHVPPTDLPSVDEVVDSVVRAHRMDRLPDLGAVRLRGTVEIEDSPMRGRITSLFEEDRQWTRIDWGGAEEIGLVEDGRAWIHSTPTGTDELDGARLEQARQERFVARFGDWRAYYRRLEVLRRIRAPDETLILVRLVPHDGPEAVAFVQEETGLVRRVDGFVHLPGLGVVGFTTVYDDVRDVDGMVLPFRSVQRFATAQIGRVTTQITRVRTGVEPGRRELEIPR